MTKIQLEGENLGQIHKNYNSLLKDIITKQKQVDLSQINYDDSDIDNFIRIDIASNNQNVNYILEVLQSEDILYASRAIKKSRWLITDDQYAHLINPEYLHSTLSPTMTTRAFSKLIFEIRQHLSEKRMEEFYNYYKDKDFEVATKWLPRCSLPFIENIVETKCNDMKLELLQQLCKQSITILEICVKNLNSYKKCLIEQNMSYYMKDDLTRLLDIAESTKERYEFPDFNAKQTKMLMREKDRVMNNFERYADSIDLKTFAKEIDSKQIKTFLMELNQDKLKSMFKFDKIKHFIHAMPPEDRFAFVKDFFIDKKVPVEDVGDIPYARCEVAMQCNNLLMECDEWNSNNFSNIYRWYIFSPFDVAFSELTKLIRAESSFTERNSMFLVLLGCAKNNKQHIETLLNYYHKKHINEPAKYKINFLNSLISKTKVFKYEEPAWKILNEIFYSLEVYNVNRNEPDVNIQSCIVNIILYNILHDQKVPETVENKFEFETLKSYQDKLTQTEKDKVFGYLLNYIESKIQNVTIDTENKFKECVNLLLQLFNLLNDWNKNIADYPSALQTVKKLVSIKKEKSWDIDSALYNVKKSWRKYMFEESLTLYPTEDACLNALKHNPKLLAQYKEVIEDLRQKDTISLAKVLKKIRTYWSQSLATEWSSAYLGKLKEKNVTGYKSIVKGLCVLLPQPQVLEIIKEYAPNETKVNWSEVDEQELTLRKLIAKNMYLSRPMLPPESIMLYAKGDYLQFALPSFNSIFDNLCHIKTRQYIPELLRAPVSLQKHGIRLIYHKEKSDKMRSTLAEVWKTNQNKTIRATVFKQVFKLLCNEKDPILLENIWNTLSGFIDDLTPEENKIIYTTLGKVEEVPRLFRAKYCIKSYLFLKSLPSKCNCESIIKEVVKSTVYYMDELDSEFLSKVLMEDFDQQFSKTNYDRASVLSCCLLTCKSKEQQNERYEIVFEPLLNKILDSWNIQEKGKFCVRENYNAVLDELCNQYVRFVGARKMHNPVSVFEGILKKMESKLPIEENYLLLRKWKILVTFAKAVDTQVHKFSNFEIPESESENYWWGDAGKFDEIFYETNKHFAIDIFECLKEDINNLYPSIAVLFEEVYNTTTDNIRIESYIKLDILRKILDISTDYVPGLIFVLNTLPGYNYYFSGEGKFDLIMMEIRKKFMNHPSRELKIHYYQKFPYEPEIKRKKT